MNARWQKCGACTVMFSISKLLSSPSIWLCREQGKTSLFYTACQLKNKLYLYNEGSTKPNSLSEQRQVELYTTAMGHLNHTLQEQGKQKGIQIQARLPVIYLECHERHGANTHCANLKIYVCVRLKSRGYLTLTLTTSDFSLRFGLSWSLRFMFLRYLSSSLGCWPCPPRYIPG